mgnify:CR=1 FL=1
MSNVTAVSDMNRFVHGGNIYDVSVKFEPGENEKTISNFTDHARGDAYDGTASSRQT